MKKTYRITLPKGARVGTIDAKVDNGTLNVTVGLVKSYMPKDGEI
jgi:HSP20 family molecular chaperone IbpA